MDKLFADTAAKIAAAELDHVNLLHAHAAKLAKESPEKPPAMMAVYEYEHRNQIEWVARIKAMLDMYKTP